MTCKIKFYSKKNIKQNKCIRDYTNLRCHVIIHNHGFADNI